MPSAKVNTIKAATGPTITSLLRSTHAKTPPGTDAAGGDAAERGSQPRVASRPPDASAPPNTPNTTADKYRKALSDIDIIKAALDAPGGASSISPSLLRDHLAQAKAAFNKLLQDDEETPSIATVLEEVQAVHQAIKSLPTPPASPRQTWAQTVASTPTPSQLPSPPRSNSPSETSEITIRIADAGDRKAVAELPNEVIVQKIHQAHPGAKAVVAARKLPSGDVRVFLADERAKAALLQDQAWTKCLGQSGSATEQLYQVQVHSVRIDSLDPTKSTDITNLQEQNQTLHPGLKISRAKWMRQGYAPNKVHATLSSRHP